MIYSLKGKIEMIDSNTIVVDVGNMAFEVLCSSYAAFDLSNKTEPQTVLTYLQVREDAMVIFGFKDKKEKTLFNQLITVSGVGPKMAITILSGLPTFAPMAAPSPKPIVPKPPEVISCPG